MIRVKCDYCGNYLFSAYRENLGAVAAEANSRKFVVKMPIFFGVPCFKVFCNKECCKRWFDENIDPETKEKGKKEVEELSKGKEKFVKEVTSGLTKITKFFRQIGNLPPDAQKRLFRKIDERRRNGEKL